MLRSERAFAGRHELPQLGLGCLIIPFVHEGGGVAYGQSGDIAPLREAIAALNCPVVDLGMGRVGASAAVFVNAFFFSTIALRDECVIELNVGFAARADGRGQRPTVN